MNINPGDKVRFLNDVGGGVVVKQISKTLVLIKSEDDFEYTVPVKDLVIVKSSKEIPPPVENTPTSKSITQTEEKLSDVEVEIKDEDICELHLAFLKIGNEENHRFECYLLNDSNYYIFFHAVTRGTDGFEKIEADKTEPNTMFKIKEFSREEINNIDKLIIQIIFYGHHFNIIKDPVERSIKIEPVKFYNEGVFAPNNFFDDNAYMFLLYKEEPGLGQSVKTDSEFEKNMIVKDFEKIENKSHKTSKPHKRIETIEIDLHINELVDCVVGLSNHEILEIQMQYFHKALTKAITEKKQKIVFIHGIGNGTLKTSIRESIRNQYKLHYEDASFKEYGFGATMVMV